MIGGWVVRRHELTEQAWQQIAPLLPNPTGPGGRWADHRRVLNGILWKLSTGVPWRDVPERYGPWQTLAERHRRWSADGTWDRLLAHVQQHSDAVGEIDWDIVVDATIVRAHQHAAGARNGGRTGPQTKPRTLPGWAEHQGPSRCRWPRPTLGGRGHCRAAACVHPAQHGLGCDPGAPAWWDRPTPETTRPSDR